MAADFSRLIEPRGVAVIGATEDARKIGGQPMRFLTEFGYEGAVYPVNPRYQTVRGLRCYASAAELPQPCDIGLIAVPGASVPQAIRDLGRAGVPHAIVLSAGFRELGERGMAIPIKVWPIQMVLPWMFVSSALRHLAFAAWPALRPEPKGETH